MTALRRRALLGGLAASAMLPAIPGLGRSSEDQHLRQLLDRLGDIAGFESKLARLDAIDAASLSPSGLIDLRTVRNGVAIDSQLARLIPGGKADLPYRIPKPSDGLGRNGAGAAGYALLLERHIGERMEQEAAHRRLEREVARLAARADRLMRAAGFANGSVGARFKAMFADSRWLYPDSDAGRDAAVADMNRWLDQAQNVTSKLIGALTPGSETVRVERMSAAEVAAGKGGYRRMPEGGRPGAYVVDLREIHRRPKWTLKSVVHHELVPGHMVQLPLELLDPKPHPLRIAYLPAFSEGWAIHAEQMMADHGIYQGAPLDALGHVHWLLFRAVRGLIDTGIHHRRWSVAKARAELERMQGVPVYFASFDQDLDRITGEPAVRAADALIWLGLSDRTRRLTGTRLQAANRAILDHGREPLQLIPNTGRGA